MFLNGERKDNANGPHAPGEENMRAETIISEEIR
jgi:hypothetical protein